jgi:hypothetical protein
MKFVTKLMFISTLLSSPLAMAAKVCDTKMMLPGLEAKITPNADGTCTIENPKAAVNGATKRVAGSQDLLCVVFGFGPEAVTAATTHTEAWTPEIMTLGVIDSRTANQAVLLDSVTCRPQTAISQ